MSALLTRLEAAGAGALFLLEHDVGDQPEDLRRAARPDVARLEALAPVADRAVLEQLVELGPRDAQADLGVGGDVAGDLGPGDLDPEELDVTAPAQLELEDELELLQRGDLALEVLDRRLDLGLGVRGGHGARS